MKLFKWVRLKRDEEGNPIFQSGSTHGGFSYLQEPYSGQAKEENKVVLSYLNNQESKFFRLMENYRATSEQCSRCRKEVARPERKTCTSCAQKLVEQNKKRRAAKP